MGQFSWIASDTNRPIIIEGYRGGPTECYLLIPNKFREVFGTDALYEPAYQGYGRFGGRDAYAVLAICNLPEEQVKDKDGNYLSDDDIRQLGINLQFDEPNKIDFPIKIVERKCSYNEVGESESDPNQGWGSGDEDDYEDDEW